MKDDLDSITTLVLNEFNDAGIEASVTARQFPDEVVIILIVPSDQFDVAVKLASKVERTLPHRHLIVVRPAQEKAEAQAAGKVTVVDSRVTRLIELLNERSRTSEQQPSLEYIKDAAENLRIAVTKRHHVVFGRRGVGKTALLLEAKNQIERSKGLSIWINLQMLRGLDANRAFLTIVQRILELPRMVHMQRRPSPQSVTEAKRINEIVEQLLLKRSINPAQVHSIVPQVQRLISFLCTEKGADLYIFLDDLHYLEMAEQPAFLDLVHGVTRDTLAWIKAAGIRNQCRIFRDNPATGLQIGHDAAEIPLDVTLEEPAKARRFLDHVLQTYRRAADLRGRSAFLSGASLDRLVLASGGVPRDFLTLTARSIQIARLRAGARVVGIQDVNVAAGEAGKQKRSELEDDTASSEGRAQLRLRALQMVREFTLDQKHYSYFRIDLRQKNSLPQEYRLLQSLMDLRMIHLIKASLSETHEAGERSEVYMIDLSEFSGSRLKKDMSVLELNSDNLVLRRTGKHGRIVKATTPQKLVDILRRGPLFDLTKFSPLTRHIDLA